MGRHLDGVERVGEAEIVAVLAELCPTTQVRAIHGGPRSYANRLWRVETDEGELLVRIPGRSTDPEVMRGALVASRLAHEAGIPTSRFRAFAPRTQLGLPVVVQEFGPGCAASSSSVPLASLGASLGEWVGRLHQIRSPWFGPVLRANDERGWGAIVLERVETMSRAIAAESLPASRDAILSVFARFESIETDGAALTHGDLYLDNVLVHRGKIACLLDFEHAMFQDRFADFGKLEELVFESHPDTRRPFMQAYHAIHPPAPADEDRHALAQGLYALTYLHYFSTWQPDLIGFYRERLASWLEADPRPAA